MNFHENIVASICEFLKGNNMIVGNRLRNDILQACINSNKTLFENGKKIVDTQNCFTIIKDDDLVFSIITADIDDIGIICSESMLQKQTFKTLFITKADYLDMDIQDIDWILDVIVDVLYETMINLKMVSIDKDLFMVCYKYHCYLRLAGIDSNVDKMFMDKYDFCDRHMLEFIQESSLYDLIVCNNIIPVLKGWV